MIDYEEIEKKVFSLIINNNPNSIKTQSFVQIKIHKTLFDDHNEITI